MPHDKSDTSRQSKASLSRKEILSVAARMMRDIGYSNMSLRDLANQVGMKAGSLYYHFASKEALATEVMRVGVDVVSSAVLEGLDALPASTTARQRVLVAMQIHLKTLLSESDFSSAHIRCYPFVPDSVRADVLEHRRSYDRLWDDLLMIHLEEQDPSLEDSLLRTRTRHLRHGILGALNWSLEWFDCERDDLAAYIQSLEPLLARTRS